jgi:HEAT repeat protein
VDTSEDRWEAPPEEEPLCDSGIEVLIEQLARTDKSESRCFAAECLGQLGEEAVPAIPTLLNAAVAVDATLRKAAMDALEAIDPCWPQNEETRKAIPDLVAALLSWSSDVYKPASRLLRVIGAPALPALSDALLDGEDDVKKVRLIRVIGRMGPDAEIAFPGLVRALRSQRLHMRIEAARALTKIGSPPETAIPALVSGLSDRSADAREAMAICLACFSETAEPALWALLPLLADRDDGVYKAAAAALEKIGPKAVRALIELVRARDALRLKAWLESMSRFPQQGTQREPVIVVVDSWEVWNNLSWEVYDMLDEQARLVAAQVAALGLLGKLGPDASAAIPTITEALADPHPGIQRAAVQALGQLGPEVKSAIPALIQMLLHSNGSIREEAASALGNVDQGWASNPAVPFVAAKLAKELSRAGRSGEVAVKTLIVLGATAVPVLIEALESGNRVAGENAARALGQIGAEARSAIPALTQALQDEHGWVREEAAGALAKIEDDVADPPTGADPDGVNEG